MARVYTARLGWREREIEVRFKSWKTIEPRPVIDAPAAAPFDLTTSSLRMREVTVRQVLRYEHPLCNPVLVGYRNAWLSIGRRAEVFAEIVYIEDSFDVAR